MKVSVKNMFKNKIMFIVSLRRLKKALICIFIAIVCITLTLFSFSKKENSSHNNNILNISANDNNSRILFIKQCGWEVNSDPVEESTVTIPSNFNETFSAYNDMQKSQGFDLSKYSGKTCQKYTYQILNYKDCDAPVKANILIYKNKIIAGDIFHTGHNGFIEPIVNNK